MRRKEHRLEAESNRNRTFDTAKGIGILCVILGHLAYVNAVFPFHMPLFFAISGWFLSEKRSPKEFFLKRVRDLMPAYCFTSVCLILLSILHDALAHCTVQEIMRNALTVFLQALYGSGSDGNRTAWGIGQIGAIWFLPAMIWATAYIRWVVEVMTRPYVRILVVMCTFVACWQSARWFWLPFSIQAGGCAALFVYLGWAARKLLKLPRVREHYLRYRKYIVPVGLVAWLYLYETGRFPIMVMAVFPKFPLTVILPILIIAAILHISKWIGALGVVARALSFYGRYSLPILCFHLIELEYCPWYVLRWKLLLQGVSYNMEILIIFLLKILFCTVLTLLASRIRPIRNLFRLPEPVTDNRIEG